MQRKADRRTAVQALAEENGQVIEGKLWYGKALCGDCYTSSLPPALRQSAGRWAQHGEQQCDC